MELIQSKYSRREARNVEELGFHYDSNKMTSL